MSEREPLPGEHPPESPATDPAEPPPEAAESRAGVEATESHAGLEATESPAGLEPTESNAGLEPDVEIVDGLPVLAEVRTVERVSSASLPAVQAAAAAGAGFVAGAATVALIKRRAARKVARTGRVRRPADLLPIAATRSFLVDVHVIARDP